MVGIGCIEWTGSKRGGYGTMRHEGKTKQVTRILWEKHKGKIPDGYYVCHKCDNPSCINLEHLFLGTNSDNIKDSFRKGRSLRKGESNGRSKLTWNEVRDIRQKYIPRLYSCSKLAKEYNVCTATINNIIVGKVWLE